MKRFSPITLLLAVIFTTACAQQQHTFVILSTNDIHSQIVHFPQLATAVERCRDTASVILVDGGDRWTGDAFVDLAENRRPIIELMNTLGYDVATLGNHEFDVRHGVLGDMLSFADFPVICANMISDTTAIPQIPPYVIIKRNGIKFGFVGIVTNYENEGYPAGSPDKFAKLTFPDPQESATKYYDEIAKKCDVMVLISHMGDVYDIQYLNTHTNYNLVIGGHSHKEIDTFVNGTLLTQTGKNLKNIGVTTIKMTGKKIDSIDFRNIPLTSYTPDSDYKKMVDKYRSNPELLKVVGSADQTIYKTGLVNLLTDLIVSKADVDLALYHIGGVRPDSIARGNVTVAQIFDIDPFGTTICTVKMTTEQIRKAIISKFNDANSKKEWHRVDMYSSTPYTIVITPDTVAVDVIFPKLEPERVYDVAVTSYIYENYKDMNHTDGKYSSIGVNAMLTEEFEDDSPVEPDNIPKQTIKKL